MKPVAFAYMRPRTLAEAIEALTVDGAKALAGAQSLGPLLNLRLARPRLLVDIARLDELRAIEETPAAWRIGAGVTHAQLEDARGRLTGASMVAEVAAGIAYRSVRNRGTIGGSLAHADPAADWPLALAALDATVTVQGRGGQRRTCSAAGFMTGPFTTVLGEDELIVAVDVPKRPADARHGYFKFCRKTGEFPEASAAVVAHPGRGDTVVYVGGLTGAPARITGLPQRLEAIAAVSDAGLEEAIAASVPTLDRVQRTMHAGCLRQALRRALRT